MFNCLLDKINSEVVSNVQSGDNIPDGYVGLEVNTTALIIVGIVFLVLFIAITIFVIHKTMKHINNTEQSKTEITNDEKQIIYQYRKLTSKEKKVIIDTINTFNKTRYE